MFVDNVIINQEVYEILNLMGNQCIARIPEDIYKIFEGNRNKNYNVKFKTLEELNTDNVSRKSIEIITYLYLEYICDTTQYANELKEILTKNEQRVIEEYSIDKVFKKRQQIQMNSDIEEEKKSDNFLAIKSKEQLHIRVINFIKRIFGK